MVMNKEMVRCFTACFWLFILYNTRPYIYIYAHQNEQDEIGVINISSVRVDHNKPLEKLLQVNEGTVVVPPLPQKHGPSTQLLMIFYPVLATPCLLLIYQQQRVYVTGGIKIRYAGLDRETGPNVPITTETMIPHHDDNPLQSLTQSAHYTEQKITLVIHT